MDLRALVPLLSVVLSALLNTGVSAPVNEVPAASLVSHVRNKRCSCATFLDKECVYFCHLDIIWVNTPERVVSYGLGNTPRKRRSAGDSARTRGAPRCRCVRGRDSACDDFCHPENPLRYDTSPGEAIPRAQGCSGAGCARTLAASAPRSKRRASGEDGQRTASRAALRAAAAAAKVRGVLETWRTRRWRPTGEKEEHAAS